MTARTMALPAQAATLADDPVGLRFAEAVAFSLLTGLCAQVELHLPFTPVPLTGQTFAVLLSGAALGPRWGAVSMLCYLIEGSSGLPFFSGGAAGAVHLLGPTGGYLLGFVPAATLTGWLMRRGWGRSPLGAAAMMLAGSSVIFALGLLRLASFVPAGGLLQAGLLPFLLGDAIKCAVAAAALPLWTRVRETLD